MNNRNDRCAGLLNAGGFMSAGKRTGFRGTAAALISMLLTVSILLPAAALLMPRCVSASENGSDTPLTNLVEGWPEMTPINEASGVVIDADTGGVLYSLNRSEVRYPASTTKIMTALLALENSSLSDTVTMGAEGLVHTTDGSTNAGTVAGEEFTMEQCLYIMLLKSANDIAVQVGVHVAGSVSAFADMMNARAAEIGCTGTHFVNPSGMPDSDHYSTAEDMALIMRECLKNEEFRKIVATARYTVPPTNKNSEERVYDNHNQLIQPQSEYYYEYDIGGKTGYTQAAWRTFVTAGEKDGMTLVAVTMRGPDKTDFVDAKNLLEYGFNNFHHETIDGVTVTLPAGIGTDATEETAEQLGDGSWKVTRYYRQLPVGSAVLTAEEYSALKPDSVSAAAEPEKAAHDEEKTEAVEEVKTGFRVPTAVLVILLIVLLIAMAGAVAALLNERRRDGR